MQTAKVEHCKVSNTVHRHSLQAGTLHSRGHKHSLGIYIAYSKHSALKNCVQPNMTLHTMTAILSPSLT